MVAYGTIRNIDQVGGSAIMTAARPPVDADGVTGDYWLDSAAHILYGPKLVVGGPVEEFSVDPAVLPVYSNQGPGNYTFGLKLRFLVAGSVTGLRFYRNSTTGVTSRTLTLYRAGVSVRTVSTSGETGGGWKTYPISAIAINTGVDYVAAYRETSMYVEDAGTPPSFSPTHMTNVNGCYVAGAAFPTNNVAANYYADLVFSPTGLTGPLWPVAIKSVAF